MKDLNIIERVERITATKAINKNTVTLMWEKQNEQPPQYVAFSVVCENGNANINGTVNGTNFEVRNSEYKTGQSALYEEIFSLAQKIINPQTEDVAG